MRVFLHLKSNMLFTFGVCVFSLFAARASIAEDTQRPVNGMSLSDLVAEIREKTSIGYQRKLTKPGSYCKKSDDERKAERDILWAVSERVDCAVSEIMTRKTPKSRNALRSELLMKYGVSRDVKQKILMDLARSGKKEDIDLIIEFEAWAKKTAENPPPFTVDMDKFGETDVIHGDDRLQLLGECVVKGKNAENLPPFTLEMDRYGQTGVMHIDDMVQFFEERVDTKQQIWRAYSYPFFESKETIWLTCRETDTRWSTPLVFADTAGPYGLKRNVAIISTTPDALGPLSGGPDIFELRTGRSCRQLDVREGTRDSDQDGLPDFREEWLGTKKDNPDSDGDGKPDGSDLNPLTPPNKDLDENIRLIRQAVFTFHVATGWERVPMQISLEGPQEFEGYAGAIIWKCRKEGDRSFHYGTMFILANVTMESSEVANVARVGFLYGPLAGSGCGYRVERICGHWVVTRYSGSWMS